MAKRQWAMWASIVPGARPGAKWEIYLIDQNREHVTRPFAKTIRVMVIQIPIGRHRKARNT